MEFITGQVLLDQCRNAQIPISQAMKLREIIHGNLTESEIDEKLSTVLNIMNESAHLPLSEPQRSMGGLIGGEAKKVSQAMGSEHSLAGSLLSKAISYSMAVLEVNASMGLIVAAPTAGSSGVVPGVLLAIKEEKSLTDKQIHKGLLNASALGCN